jgi:hypothetical protein
LFLARTVVVKLHLRRCARCRERLRLADAFVHANADVSEAERAADAATTPASSACSASDGSGVTGSAGLRARPSPEDRGPVPGVDVDAGVSSTRLMRELDFLAAGFEDQISAERHDTEAKRIAREHDFTGRLHKQKQRLIHRQPVSEGVRQWLPAAALIPLLVVGLAFSRLNTVVRADELLSRASHYERSLPADYSQQLRLRFTPGMPVFAPLVAGGTHSTSPRVASFLAMRHVTGGVARDTGFEDAAAGEAYAAVAETLARHGFDWRQPLSLVGVHAWRESAGQLHDEVFATGDLLVLKMTTPAGELREVHLTVRRHDYHVVRLMLAFEGIGRLEIAEVEDSVQRAAKAATPVAPIAAAPVAMTSPSAPAPVARGVARESAATATPVARTTVVRPGLSRWLERNFRPGPDRTMFAPRLQRLVSDVRQQLATLDTLARRYPEEEVEQQWSSADRADLRRRVNDAYDRVSRDLNDLDTHIGVLFGSTSRSLPVKEAPADWRRRAAVALAHAEAMDGQVRQLLTLDDLPSPASGVTNATGATSATSSTASAPSAPPVMSTFTALWDVVHAPAGGPASR